MYWVGWPSNDFIIFLISVRNCILSLGLYVESPTEFHILLYLNHMAVFNYVDDGNVPGCAALKLSDGRKRSMSLWIEFITASGK